MTGRFSVSNFFNKVKNYLTPDTGRGPGEGDRNSAPGGGVGNAESTDDISYLGHQRQQQTQRWESLTTFRSRSETVIKRSINGGGVSSGHQQQRQSQAKSFSSYFSIGSSRKRAAVQELAEVEFTLTDDEEDPTKLNGGSYNHNHLPKKLRTSTEYKGRSGNHSEEGNMAADQRRYVTRGSGIDPAIEGLDKQPWMFNFKSKKTRMNSGGDQNESSAVVEIARGTLYGNDSCSPGPSFSRAGNSLSSLSRKEEISPEVKDSQRNFRFQKSQADIEVITLDEAKDDDVTIIRQSKLSEKLENHVHADTTKKLKTPMKTSIFKSLNNALTRNTNSFRLNEKAEYANLIRRMQFSMSSGYNSMVTWGRGRALEKSKLNTKEITAKYYNFGSPAVTFNMNQSLTGSPYLPVSASEGNFKRPLDGRIPHSFSIPSSRKSTPAAATPELIDITFDEEKDDAKSSKSLVKYSNGSAHNITSQTSFHDLNEALQSGILSDNEDSQDSLLAVKGPADSEDSQDPDISVISKAVLDAKPRTRRLNSLELEHQDVPYTKKDWLDGVSTTWREEQKHREKQILENMETIDVLQKESTIEKDLRERMRNRLRITEIIVLEEPPPSYPEISQDMQEVIDLARRPGYDNDVLATVFGVSVTRGDIKTLAPCKWLNDNVINVYMELISKRSKQEATYPTVHAFSTFFYPKLLKEGYSNALKRWTRKVDIFSSDLLVFPIHLGLHWCLACVDFRNKTIKYYDSLGGRNDKCLHSLLNYIALEKKERKSEILNKEEWMLENVEDTPQQQNGSDCGMFSCKVAEYLSRDAELTFSQENMNYFRERMIYEIIKSDLLFP